MQITGSLVNAFFICHRKAWLLSHQLSPDREWELLEEGRILAEGVYKRQIKELTSDGIKIDIFRRTDGKVIIGELKKSSKGLEAGLMQLAFYLYQFRERGVRLKGELLIPKEKRRIPLELSEDLIRKLDETFDKIRCVINSEVPPAAERVSWCQHCAYSEFCWAEI